MNTSIISGLIGGLIAVTLISFVSAKVRRAKVDGQLAFSWPMIAVACMCLLIAAFAAYAFFYDESAKYDPVEMFSIIALFIFFFFGALACFAEYFITCGTYDEHGISQRTPWTGLTEQKWDDLTSIEYKPNAGWYALNFNTGKKIRLSNFLVGHGDVITLLLSKGYKIY